MLDTQAKKDLKELVNNLSEEHQKTFWDTLECVGCAEEFKRFRDGR